MNRRISLVLIAFIGVGLYTFRSTIALFAGQHSFVNIDATGNQINCVKCHGDMQPELSGQLSTVTGTDGSHANFEYFYCHRGKEGASNGDNAYATVTFETDVADVNNRYSAIVKLRGEDEI